MTSYLRDSDLAKRYGVHRSTVWRWVRKGLLPKPIRLTPGCTRWNSAEIYNFEAKRETPEA